MISLLVYTKHTWREALANSKITVKDLARMCGVSIGTIDRAINNRGGINLETKKKILETAREYGFVKNQNALTLSSGLSNLIGVIVTNLKTEYFTTLLTVIETTAHSRGYSTLIMMTNYDSETEIDCVARMRSMNVAGIILFSILPHTDYYTSLVRDGVRVVAVGNRIVDGVPFVGINDSDAMKAGTEFVLSKGYNRLIYVAPLLEKAPRQNISAQSERLNGFLAAIENSEAEYEIIGNYADYSQKLPTLSANSRKTALVCPSDVYTLKCLSLHKDKFGIMGFDRMPTIETFIPKMSGITYPTVDIGSRAVSVLLDGGGDAILPFEIYRGETV